MDIKNIITGNSPLIWIETKEYERCERLIKEHSQKDIFIWDIDNGIYSNETDEYIDSTPFDFINDCSNTILIMKDLHCDISEVKNWRGLVNKLSGCLNNDNNIIIVSPILKIPSEISHYFLTTRLPLPNYQELEIIIKAIAKEHKIKDLDLETMINLGLGLTEFEFKNAIWNSINISSNIESEYIMEFKKEIVKKSGVLELHNPKSGFDSLCGMKTMKDFAKNMICSGKGKGILILGVPGGGKTAFAKALGWETNRLTVSVDFGALMGSYVGETEQKTKEAFNIIDGLQKSIVFIDEIEKGLSGASSSSDSVSKRQGGQFLKWLQDHESDSYVVATANDISSLPSEYLRAGRWDAIFFVDMPTKETKRQVLEFYKKKFNISEDIDIENEDYTGAEIESLCRLSSSLGVKLDEASKYICPISKTNKESLEILRGRAALIAVNAEESIMSKKNIHQKNKKRSI